MNLLCQHAAVNKLIGCFEVGFNAGPDPDVDSGSDAFWARGLSMVAIRGKLPRRLGL